jgi:hypothetical protein
MSSKVLKWNEKLPIGTANGQPVYASHDFIRFVLDDFHVRMGGNTALTNTELATAATSAQNAADAAQTSADTAQASADTAQGAADDAQADATSALGQITTLSAIQYLTLAASGSLANERVLTAGAGIDFVDAGTGSTLTIAIDVNVSLNDSLSATIVQVADGALGLFGATPVAQPTTAGGAATFVANAGTAVNDASTFDGYTIKQVVKALRDVGALA